jgi:hypothetical protein
MVETFPDESPGREQDARRVGRQRFEFGNQTRRFSARKLVISSDSFDIEPVSRPKTDTRSRRLIRILGPYAVGHKDFCQDRRRPRALSSSPCWVGPSCVAVMSGYRGGMRIARTEVTLAGFLHEEGRIVGGLDRYNDLISLTKTGGGGGNRFRAPHRSLTC